jgi:hypothetical protein
MSALQVWLEIDWDAPARGLRALEDYVRSVRAGDPAELAVAAGALSEEEAGERLMALIRDDAELATRQSHLPEIVVYAGGVPADVEEHLRLPGPGEQALKVLREELAPYVALTPILNQAEWARSWKPEPGFRHLFVDNASDDGTADILTERGADVVVNDRRLSRVENWQQAVRVFLELSDAQWMKWIFAGDRLLPGAADILDRATATHPEVRMIAAEYDWKVADGRVVRFSRVGEEKVLEPHESLYRFTVQGNFLGGPAAIAMHRDVLGELEFGHHPFVADWQACLEIARRHKVLAVTDKIALFDASRARHHRAHEHDVYTVVQDAAMRYQALGLLREMVPNLDLSEIESKLDSSLGAAMVQRISAKQQPEAAPPSTRVAFEANTSGGATRMRLGGRSGVKPAS